MALASARFPPSFPRPALSAREPTEHTGRPLRARPRAAGGGGQKQPLPAGSLRSSGEVDSNDTDARNSTGKV